jgi:hypothetical protein
MAAERWAGEAQGLLRDHRSMTGKQPGNAGWRTAPLRRGSAETRPQPSQTPAVRG